MKYVDILDAAWQQHLAPREPDAPTVISLFAGCGGSSLGYSMAGYRELLAVEWDDNAVETFRLNFPDVAVHHGDIAALSVEQCLQLTGLKPGQLDVLDGSPPCQGFSTAGKRMMHDSRNSLFREYVRLLRGLQPRAFIMENVSGMVKGKMRLIFVEILKELKASGYKVSARLMNAMYFNVPQSRQRMIFVGIHESPNVNPSHPAPATRAIGIRDAIGIRRGWGPRGDGIVNKQFNNKYRSLSLPSCTLEATRPPILRIDGNERFPPAFKWTQSSAYQRIGNSVPPLFMRAIAEHVREHVLIAAKQEKAA